MYSNPAVFVIRLSASIAAVNGASTAVCGRRFAVSSVTVLAGRLCDPDDCPVHLPCALATWDRRITAGWGEPVPRCGQDQGEDQGHTAGEQQG